MQRPTRALFVNAGILGTKTFARFIQHAFTDRPGAIHSTQIRREMGARAREFVARTTGADAYRDNLASAIQGLARPR